LKTVGIIVEYNPLHNGHVYHFQQSKQIAEANAVVAVMSGSFLQRGEPALLSKWARAEMALRMGVDLVIELPVSFSSQPAEWFAFGAVSALDATGVVDSFCFGSECGDIGLLEDAAKRLHTGDRREAHDDGDEHAAFPSAFRKTMQEKLKGGSSYPAAYAAAAGALLDGDGADWLAQPNNTLGLHYMIARERLSSAMQPYTIRRFKADYSQTSITDERIASATALRKLLSEEADEAALQPYIPAYTLDILRREIAEGRGPVSWDALYRALFARIATTEASELAGFAEMTEGLEHRILRAAAAVRPELDAPPPFEQLMQTLKTKRYTRAKLQRVMTRLLLNHRKAMLASEILREGVPYLRVLGFSAVGRQLLNTMRKAAKVPVVVKATSLAHPLLDLDIQSAVVHASAFPRMKQADLYRDYYGQPIQV
jgi:predicted nucleotidyltransferase